ncbi:hypothetical protein [Microbacterium enclense]|uniref:hypothetical protein n=1 Tax=Microbacterium enclense TaxID=993073 RepID=UPI000FE3F56C|nr:hypothetical protein [Microbacterium enclense]
MNAERRPRLDERRLRLVAALDERRPELANAYESALALLESRPEWMGERTRVSLISHAMREVMNRVLSAMGRPTTPVFKPTSSDQIKKLPELLVRHPELDLEREGDSQVVVPAEVASAMVKLFKAAVHEKRRVRGDVAALLTDDGNDGHAAVERWVEAKAFFVKWAHLHDHEVDPASLPSDHEMLANIAIFEELFDGVITAFFARKHAVQDLLAEINATEGSADE